MSLYLRNNFRIWCQQGQIFSCLSQQIQHILIVLLRNSNHFKSHIQIKYYKLFALLILKSIINLNIIGMIKTQQEYYIIEADQPITDQKRQEKLNSKDVELEAIGSIKERLEMMRERVDQIKQFKAKDKNITKNMLNQLIQNQERPINQAELSITIPSELIQLQLRLQQLQQKIQLNEILKNRMDRRGTIVQRIKKLQTKLEDMIKNKSSENIISHITNFHNHLDDKQETMKYTFLYETYTKTQGLKEQIKIIEGYLKNLNNIQIQIAAEVPMKKLIDTHNQIIIQKTKMQSRIQKMYGWMKQEYQKMAKEIDSI